MSRVGKKIEIVRNKQNMTQKQFAKKLGVAEKFIKEVEMGKKIVNEAFIEKVSKLFGEDINDITMSFEEQAMQESAEKGVKNIVQETVKDVWDDALGSVLKTVPVYGYDLNKVRDSRRMPIISNKIEGFAQDKALFIEIEDDDMLGFRIAKGDIAFANITHEIENNSICLVEYNGERAIRQVKVLDAQKILLINNKGTLRTETLNKKAIKILARLNRVEIKL